MVLRLISPILGAVHTKAVSLKHLDHLDGWRAVAALWVVTEHCLFSVDHHFSGAAGQALKIFGFARMAVDLFIVLSGFCLMLPILVSKGELRGGALEFLRRRAWRILPPYYAALALCLILIHFFIHEPTGTIWDEAIPVSAHGILTHLLLLHDAFPPSGDVGINYVFWSIAVEWRIYFFFPLLLLAWRHLGPVRATVLGFGASWILRVLCNHLVGAPLTLNYLGLFAGGMLAAAIAFPTSEALSRWQNLPWDWIAPLLFAISLGAYCLPDLHTYLKDYIVGLWAMSALILTSIRHHAWHHRWLSSRPLVFIGTFAYSIYLIHSPLLQLLWQYLFAPLQPHPYWMFAALLFPGLPLVLAGSYLFYLGFERPFVHRRKRIIASTPMREG